MTEKEEILTKCCRKFCKTDKMDDDEFERYTGTVCNDCPIYELEDYHERELEEQHTVEKAIKILRDAGWKEI